MERATGGTPGCCGHTQGHNHYSSAYTIKAGEAGWKKGGLTRDRQTEEVLKYLCGDAFHALLKALDDLRTMFPPPSFTFGKDISN